MNPIQPSRREVLAAAPAAGLAVSQPADAAVQPSTADWAKRPYRMIQYNLQLTDATLDPVKLARQTRAFGANVLVFNMGGIWAFYPTDLQFHTRNPFLKSDIFGDMLKAAHAEGIAVVGRFDFSKTTRAPYDANPAWYQRDLKGDPLVTSGCYQTCVNGDYYQDYAQRILTEALTRYPVDGLFYNMFGYARNDYTETNHGICVCDNCRRVFREMYHRELPTAQGFGDPAWNDYLEFQERTVLALGEKCYATAKAARPGVVVTGQRGRCDAIRMEIQRNVARPPPEWAFQAGDEARWAVAFGRGKPCSSTSTNFTDFPWRLIAESGDCHVLRFAQQLGNGASLDYYLMGTLDDQTDRRPFKPIMALYAWHRKNAAFYEGLRPAARVAIYDSTAATSRGSLTHSARYGSAAARGATKALIDARIPFRTVVGERIGESDLSQQCDVLVLANTTCLSDAEAAAIDAFVAAGGTLIATGETGAYDEKGRPRAPAALACSPIARFTVPENDVRGSRFVTTGSGLVLDAPYLALDGLYFPAEVRADAMSLMPAVGPVPFGPPELCFPEGGPVIGKPPSGPGLHKRTHGNGIAIHLPWLPDWLYYRDGLQDYRALFAALIARHAPALPVKLTGPGAIEVTIQKQAATGRILIHLINYSGQRNTQYDPPVPIDGLRLGIHGAPRRAHALVAGHALKVGGVADGYAWIDLPRLAAFEAISLD